jgi:hypothetical protein
METRGKIYLATSDQDALERLRGALEPAGYRLQEPMDWNLVTEEVGFFGADVVLLGDEDGGPRPKRILEQLREHRDVDAAVMVLGVGDEGVPGWWDAGADDVLAGPFVPQTLLRRVQMQLRLRAHARATETLPELGYVTVADESDDFSVPRPPMPDHLPKGLDGFYEKDLATLIEVSEAMASSVTAEDALYVIVRRLANTIPVSRCNITVRGVKSDEVVVVASHDDANMRSRSIRLSRYPEINRCLEGGEMVLIEDVHADADMREVLDFIKSVDLRSALVLPLYVKEIAVGALSMTSRRAAHGFTQRELLFTRAMVNIAAGVVAASDLIERLRRGEAEGDDEVEVFDEVVLGVDDAIEELIEELERK